jgi:hypothetical protein
VALALTNARGGELGIKLMKMRLSVAGARREVGRRGGAASSSAAKGGEQPVRSTRRSPALDSPAS